MILIQMSPTGMPIRGQVVSSTVLTTRYTCSEL